jgi:hypothetical protein
MYHNVTRKQPPAPATDETDEPEKKERVIHTRVPESLEAELRQRAEKLGMSVSNLVRNVLGHAFGLVGDVVADSHAIARAARGNAKGTAPTASSAGAVAGDPEEVIAWQEVVLAKNAICSRCNDICPRGSEAAIAVGGDRAIVCKPCLEELRK